MRIGTLRWLTSKLLRRAQRTTIIPPTSPATLKETAAKAKNTTSTGTMPAFHEAPLAPAALDNFLEVLRKTHGPRLLRGKGIVALADDPLALVVIPASSMSFIRRRGYKPGLTLITAPAYGVVSSSPAPIPWLRPKLVARLKSRVLGIFIAKRGMM